MDQFTVRHNPAFEATCAKSRAGASTPRWGSPSVRHFAVSHHTFSRSVFAVSGACSSPCHQRRLSVPLGRKGPSLALSIGAFGSSALLHRRGVRVLHHSPCRVESRPVAPEFGTSVAVKRPRVPLGGSCLRQVACRVEGCDLAIVGGKVTLSRAAASSLAAASLSVAVARAGTVSAFAAPRSVCNATAPTLRSSGPAQKAAQAAQLER